MTVLPGDPTDRALVKHTVRADHAGEHAAAAIQAGQHAVRRRGEPAPTPPTGPFATLVAARRVRPSLLLPLWRTAGFTLGAVSAALGPRAATACTAAVQAALDEHHAAQAATLPETEAPLRDVVEQIRAETAAHRDMDAEDGAGPVHRLASAIVKTGCKAALRLSERL